MSQIKRIALLSIGAIGIIVVFGLIAYFSTQNTPEPATNTTTIPDGSHNSEDILPEDGDLHSLEEDELENNISVGDSLIARETITSEIVPFAESAVKEYVTQSSTELPSERHIRLSKYFTISSGVPDSRAPAVDTSDTENIYTIAEVLYSTFEIKSTWISVFVAMKTNSYATDNQIVSTNYQVYETRMPIEASDRKITGISLTNRSVIVSE